MPTALYLGRGRNTGENTSQKPTPLSASGDTLDCPEQPQYDGNDEHNGIHARGSRQPRSPVVAYVGDAMDLAPNIPSARVAAFVRQFTHDVRNVVNSLDLETGIVEEFVSEGEGQESVQRVRRQLHVLAERMRSISTVFQDPQPIAGPIAARELLLIWQEKHAALAKPPEVQWHDEVADEMVNVDVEMLATVFRELLVNAAAFSAGQPLTATARIEAGSVIFELSEPKKDAVDPDSWGEAFFTTRGNGYGLGLWAAKRSMQATGATLIQRYIPERKELTTQIVLIVV